MATSPYRGVVPDPDPTTLTNDAVERANNSLRELLEAKIEALADKVKDRFELLEKQTTKAAGDVKSAVDAAFAAAAASVSQQNQANFLASQKQEAAFTKQIDQLTATGGQISKAADDKISDLKDRLVAMEGRRTGNSDSLALIFSLVAAAGVVCMLIFNVIEFTGRAHP
jgi:uncharacterized membrane protein YccC